MLTGKKILIGVTGSIAAYKTPLLVRQLIREGAEVKVIMTPAAADFVSKLTLSTLSRNEVLTDLFDEKAWSNHVALGRWADLMIIAPLSCNSLSKIAHGACDNLLLATYLSATCPVWVAPAMDEDMWQHITAQQNLAALGNAGCKIIPVAHGELASGLVGYGRMAEPDEIFRAIQDFFFKKKRLSGYRVLITAGPTHEAIDPVRFIGNHSSGKMGYALADRMLAEGADVSLVTGPVAHVSPPAGAKVIKVNSADEMYNACLAIPHDIAVMAAAVADYKPAETASSKIKKENDSYSLNLVKTPDILKSLGDKKKNGQLLVGFALETENEAANAKKKLASKNADMIVLNSLKDEQAGFGVDTNKITIYYKNGSEKSFPLKSKQEVASDIVDAIIELLP